MQIFQGAFSILRRCLRGRFVHRYNFDYMRSFLRAYHGVSPYFLLSSFHEGHEGGYLSEVWEARWWHVSCVLGMQGSRLVCFIFYEPFVPTVACMPLWLPVPQKRWR